MQKTGHAELNKTMGKTLTNITESINNQLDQTVYGNTFKLKKFVNDNMNMTFCNQTQSNI